MVTKRLGSNSTKGTNNNTTVLQYYPYIETTDRLLSIYTSVVVQANCKHPKATQFKDEIVTYDILKGLEISKTLCPNCHKVLSIRIKTLRGGDTI